MKMHKCSESLEDKREVNTVISNKNNPDFHAFY